VRGRVDLSPHASAIAGAIIQARPDRMVMAEGHVLVTLANADEKLVAVGEGRVAVIEPDTDTVSSTVDLAGLKGCSALFPLAGTKLVFVSCGGSLADPDPTKSSGLVTLDLSTSPPTIDNLTMADAFGGQPLNPSWVAAVSQARGFVGTQGTLADVTNGIPATKDALFSFDLMMVTSAPLTLDAGPFELGRAAVSATTLFVPDATPGAPRLHVLDVPAIGAPTERTAFAPDPTQGLPPREIAWY
jgi:hypothetical protein